MTKILLVGGPDDVRRDIERQLRKVQGEIIDHWTYREKAAGKALPRRTEVVYVLTDMASHKLFIHTRELAKASKVPVVMAVRKWSISEPRYLAAVRERTTIAA